MVEKMSDRKRRESEGSKGNTVPVEALAAASHGGIEIVRK